MANRRIYSFNVNGIRAAEKKGFSDWLASSSAEIVGLQEVRALEDQIPKNLRAPEGWHIHLSAAERKGYSGVGIYSKRKLDAVEINLGNPEFDAEGRVQIARIGELLLANVYFPNGSGKDRDNSRVPYKLDFYKALFDIVDAEKEAGCAVLVLGDYNTAHEEIDLARPKSNHDTSGFMPEERAELTRWLDAGWTDTFRHFHPGKPDHYSWWSQRGGARERNVGWRIDYILASPAAMKHVKAASIHPEVMCSDHCPISVDVAPGIFK